MPTITLYTGIHTTYNMQNIVRNEIIYKTILILITYYYTVYSR